ncbi:MAG TPA: tetratricopeptide repeat protein, partial [Polyangia bacterium]|nr:tetratricopeptide repeat protein [Polyangia bacterium]
EKSDAMALPLFRRACEAGHQGGCTNLAILLERGFGTAPDLQAAQGLYEKACPEVPEACTNLGLLRLRTPGQEQRAVADLGAACKTGVAVACYALGSSHVIGVGTPNDFAAGEAAFARACQLGLMRACQLGDQRRACVASNDGKACLDVAVGISGGEAVSGLERRLAEVYARRGCTLRYRPACAHRLPASR